jgi:hypothetical protein
MVNKRTRRREHANPDPCEAGLAEIDRWRTERLSAHEEVLRTYPDRHLVEAQRVWYARVIEARAAELRAEYLARTAKR